MFKRNLVAAAVVLAFTGPVFAQDSELGKIREEIRQMKDTYEKRIQQLEKRLSEAEGKAGKAEAAATKAESTAGQAQQSAAKAETTASAAASRSGENAFNPAVSLILQGTYARTSQDPNRFQITGFAPSGGEVGPPKRSFGLAETELVMSANIDPYFRGVAIAALHWHAGFGQKLARLEDPTVLEQSRSWAPAGRLAAARQVGWRYTKSRREIRHIHAGPEVPLQQGGVARDQPPCCIGLWCFGFSLLGLTFQPDTQQPDIMFCRPVMRWNTTVHFSKDCIHQDVNFLLGMHFANPQMQRGLGQRNCTVAPEKQRRSKDLRASLEAVHYARRDENGIVGCVAARHARNGYSPLSLCEPKQARLRDRSHRLNSPAAACGKPWNGNQPQLRRGVRFDHLRGNPNEIFGNCNWPRVANPSEKRPVLGTRPGRS